MNKIPERNFPDFIEAYLEYTKHHEATQKIHLWTAISIIAGAMERKVWLPRGYYTLFPNLYIFIIGKSGLIKKSTSTAIGVDLLREMPGFKIMSERMTAGSLIDQIHGSGKTFELDGKRMRQSPIYGYASELAVFVTEVFGSITELLTTFYDCQPQDAEKPWIYANKKDGEKRIFGPCMNILGASTKEWLRRTISVDEMMGGFTSRVLFVCEAKGPEKFVAWPNPPLNSGELREKLVQDLLQIYSMAGTMKPTDKARDYFDVWYQHHMKNVVPKNTDPRFSGYLGRKGDMILKLAMIRSASLGNTLVFTHEHVMWAGSKLETLEETLLWAFDDVVETPIDEIAVQLSKYISVMKLVTIPEIRLAFPKFAMDGAIIGTRDLVKEALDLLRANNYIEFVREKEDDMVWLRPSTPKEMTNEI